MVNIKPFFYIQGAVDHLPQSNVPKPANEHGVYKRKTGIN